MERCGNIVSTDGVTAVVSVKMANSCSSSCENYGICKKHEEKITALNKIGAAVGDRVRIEYDNGPFLLYAFVTFILPLIMCIGGAALGFAVAKTEAAAVICGIIGFAISVAVIFFTNALIKKREKTAVITAVEQPTEDAPAGE